MLLSFVLSSPVSFFKLEEHDSFCVCFFDYLFSLSQAPLTRNYWDIDIVVSHVKLFIKSVSDHYAVDFPGKGRVF